MIYVDWISRYNLTFITQFQIFLLNIPWSITFFSNSREKKKKERESMSEADFLEYKRNFEAKMKVPTTPHKKELKNKSIALIEYI